MSPLVSPGVYTLERDFSAYAPELATSILGIVTTASKGPVNVPTLITDMGTLQAIFGPPTAGANIHMGLYAAMMFLRRGNQLWVVRVATYDVSADPVKVKNGGNTTNTLEFSVPSSGSWANSIKVVVANSAISGRYNILILDGTATVEAFSNLLIGSAHASDPNYITNRITATASDYVTVNVLDDTQTDLKTGTYSFSGGDDGAPASTSDIIGSVGSPPVVPASGLQIFRNPEAIDLNIIAVPGSTSKFVIAELLDIAATRADAMSFLTVPYGKSVQEAVDWHNGLGGGSDDPTGALDSSYAALFYPWVQVFDSYANSSIWISPEGAATQCLAYTDSVAAPWYSIAGPTRGKLLGVTDIEYSPTQGERDYMVGPGNNVNCLINGPEGFELWTQKTLQRAATDLDRINVRRLLLYLRKVIATGSRILVHEPNDAVTWRRFVDLTEPVLRDVTSRRGLMASKVICDETTNTALWRSRKTMRGLVLVQPTEVAEIIQIEFVALPQGASIAETVISGSL